MRKPIYWEVQFTFPKGYDDNIVSDEDLSWIADEIESGVVDGDIAVGDDTDNRYEWALLVDGKELKEGETLPDYFWDTASNQIREEYQTCGEC